MKLLDIKIKRVYKLENSQFLKAFVDIVVNDSLLIKGVKVLERRNGLGVSMPQEQAKDKKWYDSVQCLNEDVKAQISEEVLNAYHVAEGPVRQQTAV